MEIEGIPCVSKNITKEFLDKNTNVFFVFGDNLIHKGHGGAAFLRDHARAVGFITKRYPANRDGDFFTPETYPPVFLQEVQKLLAHIQRHPYHTYYVSKLGANLANRYGIWESIIFPELPKRLAEYREQVVLLWG